MWNTIITFTLTLGLPVIAVKLIVFAVLERLRPAELAQPLSAYLLNLRIIVLYLVASNYWAGISALVVTKVGSLLGLGLVDLRFVTNDNVCLKVLGGLLVVLIVDFFYYWFHRFQHVIPSLWAQHKIHHLDEHVNASTAYRHHWLEELFRIPFLAVPIAVLFKLDPMPAGLIGIFFSSWGFFIHSNLRLELGLLTRIFGGPQVHRIHHSQKTEHFNKNFAAFFPLWDILFGTYYHPRTGEFPATGISGEKLLTVRNAALLPFYIWIKKIKTVTKSISLTYSE